MRFSPGSEFANSCGFISKPVSGVLASDHVVITPPSTWPVGASVYGYAANDTVSYEFCTTLPGDFGTAIDVKFLVLRP